MIFIDECFSMVSFPKYTYPIDSISLENLRVSSAFRIIDLGDGLFEMQIRSEKKYMVDWRNRPPAFDTNSSNENKLYAKNPIL